MKAAKAVTDMKKHGDLPAFIKAGVTVICRRRKEIDTKQWQSNFISSY